MHTSSLYVMEVEKNLEIIPGWMFRPEVEPGPESPGPFLGPGSTQKVHAASTVCFELPAV